MGVKFMGFTLWCGRHKVFCGLETKHPSVSEIMGYADPVPQKEKKQ